MRRYHENGDGPHENQNETWTEKFFIKKLVINKLRLIVHNLPVQIDVRKSPQ